MFIFVHLSCVHLATLKIHSISQTPLNFEQRISLEVVNDSGNKATGLVKIPKATSLVKIPLLFEAGIPGSLGSCSKKKEWAVTGGLGQSGLSCVESNKGDSKQRGPATVQAGLKTYKFIMQIFP